MAWENDKPMVPVFQESYSPPDPSERLEPHIESLINYDGVKLLDPKTSTWKTPSRSWRRW